MTIPPCRFLSLLGVEIDTMMRAKFICLLGAVALLAACETTPGKDKSESTTTTTTMVDPGALGGAGVGGVGAAGMAAPGTKADFEVNVGDRVLFLSDSSEISPEARAILARQADWLKRYANVQVMIEGHCDERGTREYNIGLGDRRAAAVKNYLIALGIEPYRIDTTSFGKEKPLVLGSDETSWSQNRRGMTTVR